MSALEEQLSRLDGLPANGPARGWTASQALQHCAQSIELSLTGYPQHKPALFRATLGRLAKRVFLGRGRMGHDLMAAVPGAPALDGQLPVAEAVTRLRAAVAAFQRHDGPLAPHFAYGPTTRDEYERLHAMHLADHLDGLMQR